MKTLCLYIYSILLLSEYSEAAECENGWVTYRNELCIKVFNSYVSYEEAKNICSAQGSETSKATLVMVKESEMQEFLAAYTENLHDYLWLGSKYDIESAQFKWDDGEVLTYTNWDVDYPRMTNASNACVELRPVNAINPLKTNGKWADVNCQKRNMVMCQRLVSWSLQDAINELIRLRKQHQEDINMMSQVTDGLRNELQTTQSHLVTTQQDLVGVTSRMTNAETKYGELQGELQTTQSQLQTTQQDLVRVVDRLTNVETRYGELQSELEATKSNLQSTQQDLVRATDRLTNVESKYGEVNNELQGVSARVVPVGYIYIEYYNQPSPRTLWPTLTWQDISSTYSGLFFRVTGGGASNWGATQTECAPRITRFDETTSAFPYPKPMSIPASGWSEFGRGGAYSAYGNYEGLRFFTEGCEVRPKNIAVRVWKRTA